jgi:tetratricopeptide (TPR) repeat protein
MAKKKAFEEQELENQYFALIQAGDDLLKEKAFEQAEAKYTEAERLIPEKQDAKNKVHALHELKKKLKEDEVQKRYDDAISAGKKLLEEEQFDEAEAQFKIAHEAKPNDPTANNLISETHQKKKEKKEQELAALEEKQKQEAFEKYRDKGDALMAKAEWTEAIQSFHLALEVILNEKGILKKIAQAEENVREAEAAEAAKAKEIAKEQALEKQYTEMLAMADQHLTNQQFEQAIFKFKEAGNIKPNDRRHRDKIDESQRKWEEYKFKLQAKKDEEARKLAEEKAAREAEKELNDRTSKFQALLDQGSIHQSKQEFVEALQAFDAALVLFPGDEKASRMRAAAEKEKKDFEAIQEKDRLAKEEAERKAEADKKAAAELKNKQRVYDILVDAGESEMKVGSIDSAISKFRRAQTVLPDVDEAKDLLAIAIERKAQQTVQYTKDSLETVFNDLMKEAERDYILKKYEAAFEHLDQAQVLFPENPQLLSMIARVEKDALEEEARQAREMAIQQRKTGTKSGFYTIYVDPAQRERLEKIKFVHDLATRYPDGLTVEYESFDRKEVEVRIIVESALGAEYKKISYDWGGRYYFKNGKPSSAFVWQKEAKGF